MSAALVLATWFGAGRAPVAPGTAGTVAALPIPLALWWLDAPWSAFALAAALSVPLAIFVSGVAAKELGRKDPQEIVIDEVAGLLVACAFVPCGAWSFAATFVLFRLLDMTKPWPISRLQDLPGGWGIVLDDVAAGLVAGLLVLAGTRLLPAGTG